MAFMNLFEEANARALEIAPPPPDRPLAAALTAFGFGLVVVALFITLQWLGLPTWVSWTGSALAYSILAYVDCALAWTRHRREYREALEDLKGDRTAPSVH